MKPINQTVSPILRSVCDHVDWIQCTENPLPEQFVVWIEEDNRTALAGNDEAQVTSWWIQVSLFTKRGLSGELDPNPKAEELLQALKAGGAWILQKPFTRIDPNGYYHTIIRVRFDKKEDE